MAVAEQIQVRDKLYIGGDWADPTGSGTIDVLNPATEEVIGRVPEGEPGDVDRAVAAARDAFGAWSQTSVQERAGYLQAIAARLGERMDEIATLIALELGMPIGLSRLIQAGLPTMCFGSMPQLMEEIVWEEEIGTR